MDETSNRIRAVIVSLAIASALLLASCSTQPEPTAHIETEAPTTSTTAPPLNLAWLNVTTTTTTIAPTVPAAQPAPEVAPADGCWIDLARQIGWPEHTLTTLARIIRRESNCDPAAFADRPSTLDNSRGLLQINAYGNLADGIRRLCGIEPDDLFDPQINLTCGLTYYQTMGFRPWGQ